jgi:hypothetical protein
MKVNHAFLAKESEEDNTLEESDKIKKKAKKLIQNTREYIKAAKEF